MAEIIFPPDFPGRKEGEISLQLKLTSQTQWCFIGSYEGARALLGTRAEPDCRESSAPFTAAMGDLQFYGRAESTAVGDRPMGFELCEFRDLGYLGGD